MPRCQSALCELTGCMFPQACPRDEPEAEHTEPPRAEPRMPDDPLDIRAFTSLSDTSLEIIFGQHIAKTICDIGNADMSAVCSLHGTGIHYGADNPDRPQPIRNAADFTNAIDAAARFFSPGALEFVTHLEQEGRFDVYVTLAENGVLTRAFFEGTDITAKGRWFEIRRATIICLLALAYAPATVARRQPGDTSEPADVFLPPLEADAEPMPSTGTEEL